ncbi:MAG: carbohydrate ABC transporter permease [Candidatus Bathyarchaeia archaeon]|nr:carbohydrate ABC transporter permease [Candidatus Bathyarchaeota archaeon]
MAKIVARKLVLYGALLAIMFFLIGPYLWVMICSVQKEADLISKPPRWIPTEPTLQNYLLVFLPEVGKKGQLIVSVEKMPRGMINSTIVALTIVVLNLFLAIPAAYSLSRFRFKGSRTVSLFIIATRMIPSVAVVIPYFIILKTTGLLDTLLALILPYIPYTLPFTIWILHGYFVTISPDLEEAAMIDGCSRLGAIIRIMIPVAVPGLVAAAIYAFMSSWNEFILAFVLTTSENAQTMPVMAAMIINEIYLPFGVLNTAAVLTSIPPAILAVFLQRYLVQGLTRGGVKF